MKEVYFTPNKKNIVVSFPYDGTIVAAVRLIPGKDWSIKDKVWKFPASQIISVVETLGAYGFSFTTDIETAYVKQAKKLKKSARYKRHEFFENEQAAITALELPLRQYQESGSAFMCTIETGLVGDQPGLGKTLQSLSAVKLMGAKKVLVFCPVSIKKQWQEEINKWVPEYTSVVINGEWKARQKQWEQDCNFYICNYHLLLRDDFEKMEDIEWDAIIADEATSISNSRAKTSKAIKQLKAKKKVALTGTPLSNKVEEVYSIMEWVRPGTFGSYKFFSDMFLVHDSYRAVTGYKNLTMLRDMLEPYMIRRLKKDVLSELPPKIYENVFVSFSAHERQFYDTVKTASWENIESLENEIGELAKNLDNPLTKLVRLKQIACSSRLLNYDVGSAKLDALKELLETALANGEKAIIFTGFKTMADILMTELAEYNPLMIAGGVSQEERDNNRSMFNEDETHRLLIMTSAGNMGLNLQRASVVVHYDLPWSIAMAEQREDRAHRQGQKNSVTVYRMLVQDTVDEYILSTLYKKKQTADTVLGDDVDEIGRLSLTAAEIKELLR